ncbi:MAG: amidohydrolase [Verrucomicrobiales bacterium]
MKFRQTTRLLIVAAGLSAALPDNSPAAPAKPGSQIAVEFSAMRADAIAGWLGNHLEELVGIYKHLHANPELSLQERKTAALVGKALRAAGFEVTAGVGGTGVVAVLKNGDGPTIMIRGDMDALPIIEQTGLEYASKVELETPGGGRVGAMHACGHDVHTTMLIGVGQALSSLREHWSGTAVLVAQPAEEVGKGARMMIADGLFERFPKPAACLSLHVQADKPAGRIGYRPGWSTANVDSVDITIFGKGGHGAKPHTTVDPIVVGASLVMNLQTLVSRRLNPIESGVVTVGSFHAGTKHNIISSEAELQLTVRSHSDEVRELLIDGIAQIASDTCRIWGCPEPPEVLVAEHYTPAGYNDPELTRSAAELFRELFGADKVEENPPTTGGEDFGRYARHLGVPGLQYAIGSIPPELYEAAQQPGAAPLPSLHSALYAPDAEPTLHGAVNSMANLAMALMQAP